MTPVLETLFADPATFLPLALTLVAAGAAIGVLAGLFGVGGGAISVPVFYETFLGLGFEPDISMPMAVGTSLAMIVPTSILSARSHAKQGALEGGILRAWAVPVTLGVAIGAAIARFGSAELFQIVFVAVAAPNAAKLLFAQGAWQLRDGLPGLWATRAYGGLVGLASALMGIGGGAITNLILTLHGVPMHRAVATSAGVGVLVAIPGAIGYMLAGLGIEGRPFDAVGYVSLLTLVCTMPAALATTRLGVRFAHALSRQWLSRLFGAFLAVVSARFLWAILSGGS